MLLLICAALSLAVIITFGIIIIHWLEMRKEHLGKSNKVVISLILLLLMSFSLSISLAIDLTEHYKNNSHVTTIEIKEIYRCDNISNSSNFIIKDKMGKVYKITANNIYQGDSNYVICYTYPNITNKVAFWLAEGKTQYDIVIKDVNVKMLPGLYPAPIVTN